MTSPAQSVARNAVSPLELFFDLVFVFALTQLSHTCWTTSAGAAPPRP